MWISVCGWNTTHLYFIEGNYILPSVFIIWTCHIDTNTPLYDPGLNMTILLSKIHLHFFITYRWSGIWFVGAFIGIWTNDTNVTENIVIANIRPHHVPSVAHFLYQCASAPPEICWWVMTGKWKHLCSHLSSMSIRKSGCNLKSVICITSQHWFR